MWREIAYLCRYGKQPVSEILKLNSKDRREFMNAIEHWITQEFDTTKK